MKLSLSVGAGVESAVFYDGDRLLGGGIITEGFLNEETTIGQGEINE